MNKLKLACLATCLVSGIASAAPSCDGFQLKLKNTLNEDLLVTTIKLDGAQIQPGLIEKLNANSEQVFTVNGSAENLPMVGEFRLHTISVPTKTLVIKYTMDNKTAMCEHTDQSEPTDMGIEKSRTVGGVEYLIK
ncbi:MAG: hypothetical protein H2069_07615 [Legionella sp.]|nr:hypothetical protein [Legionella sp.]